MPLRALRRLAWFRVLLVAELLVALSVTGGLWLLHRQTLQAEGRMLSALARAMALQADRTLEVGTTVLRTTRDELERGLVLAPAADTAALLRERVRALPGYEVLALFDRAGRGAQPVGIVDQAGQSRAARALTMDQPIGRQLRAKRLRIQPGPGPARLKYDQLELEPETAALPTLGVVRRPAQHADVVVLEGQQRVSQILQVVLVVKAERRAIVMTPR